MAAQPGQAAQAVARGEFTLALGSLIGRLEAGHPWAGLDREVARWRRSGHVAHFWWRDDDARRPSPALEKLCQLSQAHVAPVALAVIPDVDLTELAAAIVERRLISVIQHGCDHVDRNVTGGFSSEFSPSSPPREIAPVIEGAWGRLSKMARAAAIYAPPWNVLTDNVSNALALTSLEAVSLYGAARPSKNGLPLINTHVDIMSWRPARFRGAETILRRIETLMRARRKASSWDQEIGILTHHKNLDGAAWEFLQAFLEWTMTSRPTVSWRAAADLLGSARR